MKTPYKLNGNLFYRHSHPTIENLSILLTGVDTKMVGRQLIKTDDISVATIDGNSWITDDDLKIAYAFDSFVILDVT